VKMSKVLLFVILVVLAGGVVGCGANLVSLSDVPIYPGAEPLAAGQNQIADPMVDRMELLAGQSGLYVEMQRYTVPASATWYDIRTFYEGTLPGDGWTSVPELTVEEEVIRFLGWSRGEGERQQSLVVGYVPDVNGTGAFMVVGVFSKQQG
jgi:hypothetical protein